MLEWLLIIAGILIPLGAAKRRRGRNMSRYLKGIASEKMLLGTLAASTGIKENWDDSVDEASIVTSIVGSWALGNWSVATNVGPIAFGVAHSDYSQAEIESWYEATSSWDQGDLVAKEVANRKIRLIGIFAGAGVAVANIPFNDGKEVKTKLNWTLATGQTLALWAYNTGSTAVGGTDPSVNFSGHANIFGI